jgi:hypothetical protein
MSQINAPSVLLPGMSGYSVVLQRAQARIYIHLVDGRNMDRLLLSRRDARMANEPESANQSE